MTRGTCVLSQVGASLLSDILKAPVNSGERGTVVSVNSEGSGGFIRMDRENLRHPTWSDGYWALGNRDIEQNA